MVVQAAKIWSINENTLLFQTLYESTHSMLRRSNKNDKEDRTIKLQKKTKFCEASIDKNSASSYLYLSILTHGNKIPCKQLYVL